MDNKTFEELNRDLEEDLNPNLKADFRFNNKDSIYIYPSTLKSLGIEMPKFEYRTSLRFTTDGYSDMIGDIRRAVWEAVPREQRTARSRKLVENFEKWWESLPRQQKLEMIATQMDELEMLSKYNQANPASTRKYTPKKPKIDAPKSSDRYEPAQTPTNVPSKLSRDDLFKIWATNNIKIFEAGLSPQDLEAIKAIRTERRVQKWQEMTPAEKTEYINELRTGQEPARYTMIDAWNNSFDIIVALSDYLSDKQVERPHDVLFSSKEFSEFQSRVMTEFWENNPELARELGDNIIHSQAKIKKAISSGDFEFLKRDILRAQRQRIKELQKHKAERVNVNSSSLPQSGTPEYMRQFISAYFNTPYSHAKVVPSSYLKEYFQNIQEFFEPEVIVSWTKNLRGEPLTEMDLQNLEYLKKTEPPKAAFINRPLELAGADLLYNLTGSYAVYTFSFSDIKVALSQVLRGEEKIDIISSKLGDNRISLPLKNSRVDMKRFEKIYDFFRTPMSDSDIEEFARAYFDSKDGDYTALVNYLKPYGMGLTVALPDLSFHPRKNIMIHTIALRMPPELSANYTCLVATPEQKIRNDVLCRSSEKFMKTHNNLPDSFLAKYLRESNGVLRRDPDFKITSPSLIVYDKKNKLSNGFKLNLLAMETVLADCLYRCTGDNVVYSLELEDLNSLVKESAKIKKFPETVMITEMKRGQYSSIPITFKKKLVPTNLQQKYLEYISDIKDRLDSTDTPWDMEELICALNPDENNLEKDKILQDKILKYEVKF